MFFIFYFSGLNDNRRDDPVNIKENNQAREDSGPKLGHYSGPNDHDLESSTTCVAATSSMAISNASYELALYAA